MRKSFQTQSVQRLAVVFWLNQEEGVLRAVEVYVYFSLPSSQVPTEMLVFVVDSCQIEHHVGTLNSKGTLQCRTMATRGIVSSKQIKVMASHQASES